MQVIHKIIYRIALWLWNFLSSLTGSRERDFEDERKRSILAFFLILGTGIAFPFAIHHFSFGNVARAIILLCVGSIQLASLIALRYLKHAQIIFRLNVLLVGIYFLFLIIIGGAHGSRILWVFIFPIYAFFLLGKREGLFWSVLLILFSLLVFVNPANFIETYPYASETKTRFIITYTLLLLMGYFVEATRERYHEIFQDHTGFQTTLATIRGLEPDKSEADFWQMFLSSIVKEYGFLMAWYGSYSDGQVIPKHSAGLVDRYLDDLVLEIREPTSPDARCAMSRAIISGQPFGYEDLAHDEGFHSWRDYALELGYQSNVALPFTVNGRIEGGIMIYAAKIAAFPEKRVEHLRFLTSEMENILHERRLAQQAKVALQKSHDALEKRVEKRTAELREANEVLEKEILERQHTEEELRSSERRLSDIINFLPDPTFVIDLEGKVIAWNHATEELTGIKADEMVGKGDYEYAIPFYGYRRPVMIDLALQWDAVTAEHYEYVKREGDTLFSETRNPPFKKEPSLFWNTARPLHNATGDIIGAIEVIRDTTDRMLSEKALKDAAQEKEIILSSLMEFVLYEDRDMKILWANRAACESAGMGQDEIVGRHCYEIWEKRQDPCPDCPVQKAIETGKPQEIEKSTPDGKSWIIRGYPVHDADNNIIGGIEVVLDITERVRAEMALKDASDIINKSPAVAFLWKNEEGWPVEFVSENIKDLFGYTVKDFTSGKVPYADTVYPDDLARIGQEVSTFSAEEGRVTFTHEPYRIVTKDGEVRWVNDNTFIRRDQHGRITHYQGIVEDITESLETEEALRESETRFRTLVENIREAFWLFDLKGQRVLYVSPAYEEIWGRSISNLYDNYEEWAESIHPDDVQYAEKSFNKILETGGGENREYRIVRPDGTVRWVQDRGFAIRGKDGEVKRIAGIAEDITERKEAEQALRTSEANYRTLFESEPDAIIIVDADTKQIVDANRSVSKLYGYTHDELCNMEAVALSAEPDQSKAHIKSIIQEKHGGPTAPIGYRRHRKKDGTEFPVEIMHGFYHRDGRPMICAIIRDITERKEAERELALHREKLETLVKERTSELEAAQDELMKRERLSVLGQLTATVSHELRNPLGVIRSSTFYLQQKSVGKNEKIKKHIDRIENQVEICDSIVGDLLEYTRGRHSQMVKGELNPWLEQIIDEIPDTDGIKIEKILDNHLPQVDFDKEKIRRVLVNLMDNAIQSIKERKLMDNSKAYHPKIEVSSKEQDGGIIITIKDNGLGMDEETIEQAFEPLFTTRAKGTGLGLANVEKIIQEHNGRVKLKSKPQVETTVSFTIPAGVSK
jgi:PAS domain S-box-containing protein